STSPHENVTKGFLRLYTKLNITNRPSQSLQAKNFNGLAAFSLNLFTPQLGERNSRKRMQKVRWRQHRLLGTLDYFKIYENREISGVES
ncbi:35546_t:CDS:2, partial [Racocetra persica]